MPVYVINLLRQCYGLLFLSALKQNCTVRVDASQVGHSFFGHVESKRNNYCICRKRHVGLRYDTPAVSSLYHWRLVRCGTAPHLVQRCGVLIAEPQPPVPNPFLREKLWEGAGRFFFFFNHLPALITTTSAPHEWQRKHWKQLRLSFRVSINTNTHTPLSVPVWAGTKVLLGIMSWRQSHTLPADLLHFDRWTALPVELKKKKEAKQGIKIMTSIHVCLDSLDCRPSWVDGWEAGRLQRLVRSSLSWRVARLIESESPASGWRHSVSVLCLTFISFFFFFFFVGVSGCKFT